MTEQECIQYIRAAIPNDTTNADELARRALSKALVTIGRTQDADWNKKVETITLESGKSLYEVGSDILDGLSDGWHIEELWRTDEQNWEIRLKALDEFNKYARGNTNTSGYPTMACFYADDKRLEFYPEPDSSSYTVWVYLRKRINQLNDVPEIYHDIVLDEAIVNALQLINPSIAIEQRRKSLNELRKESMIAWRGNIIRNDRNLGRSVRSKANDSHNLRGYDD